MMRFTRNSLALLSLALALPAARLAAQAPTSRFSVALFSGTVTGLGSGGDDGKFHATRDDGARFTVGLAPGLAVRASVTRALRETSGAAWGKNEGQDVETWRYGAEVVAGPSAPRGLRPYVFGGVGLTTSNPPGDGAAGTGPAARAGAGVEWRPGGARVGALLEGGASAYRLRALGVRQTQLDFAWNGGLALHW
jgi:hypothetical protein